MVYASNLIQIQWSRFPHGWKCNEKFHLYQSCRYHCRRGVQIDCFKKRLSAVEM